MPFWVTATQKPASAAAPASARPYPVAMPQSKPGPARPFGSAGAASRELTRTRILAAVRDGVSDRAELCAQTGLSRSTVTRLVRELVAGGELVEDTGPGDARTPGRPVKRVRPAPRADLVLAVDFGHSHCEVAIVDADGTVLAADRQTLDVDAAPEQAIRHAERTAQELLRRAGDGTAGRVVGGALGLPAPVDVRSGSIGDGNVLPRWVDRQPAHELADRLELPFTLDNDANLGALAEAAFGAGLGVDDLVYVKAATGIGAGLLLGGRLHHGARGRAGEIGHVPVDPAGGLCRCGNRGCLETMASLTQVLAAVQPRHDTTVTMTDVVAMIDAGDPGVRRVVGDAGRLIGRVLADVVNSLSPELVVVGGELAAAGAPLLAGLRESMDRYAQPGLAADVRLELGALGERSSLLGAAALALAQPVAHRT